MDVFPLAINSSSLFINFKFSIFLCRYIDILYSLTEFIECRDDVKMLNKIYAEIVFYCVKIFKILSFLLIK